MVILKKHNSLSPYILQIQIWTKFIRTFILNAIKFQNYAKMKDIH